MDEIDLNKTSAAGIDVVRRPTGGRAILHANELTYSVVMQVKDKNVLTVYEDISRALLPDCRSLAHLWLSRRVSRIFRRSIELLRQRHASRALDDMKLNAMVKSLSVVPNGVTTSAVVKKWYCSMVPFCLAPNTNK